MNIRTESIYNEYNSSQTSSLGYFGSELGHRWENEGPTEVWYHYFDLSTTVACRFGSDKCYSITDQQLRVRPKFDSSITIPEASAGAMTSPELPGGNWGEVALEVLKAAVTQMNRIASLGKSANDIYNAYNKVDFGTNVDERVEFDANYGYYSKHTASHSGTLAITSPTTETSWVSIYTGSGEKGGTKKTAVDYWVRLKDGTHGVWPSTQSAASVDESTDQPVREMFDKMDDKQLQEIGVKRVEANSDSFGSDRVSIQSQDSTRYIANLPIEMKVKKINQKGRSGRRTKTR